MEYREWDPPAWLADRIVCLWNLQAAPGEAAPIERVLPDGCPEIIVNRADPFRRVDPGARAQDRCLVVGPLRRALLLAPTGAVDLVGVRIQPGSFGAFCHDRASALTDVDAPASDVLGAPLAEELTGRAMAGDRDGLFAALGQASGGARGSVSRVAAAAIARSGGAVRIDAVASALGTSVRTLERRFRDDVGLSPKVFARVQRLQAAVRLLEAGATDGATVAVRAGYADQPHLIREFRALAGVTPRAWLAESRGIADVFFLP